MIRLEQYLREKIDYKNKMHDFDLGTETLKFWLDEFQALNQNDVSECVHPIDELVNGDEGLFCCKCQKYVRSDAHIH